VVTKIAIRERAKAKVNLTLHVKGRRPDGYHEIESLVAFADTHDELLFERGASDSLTVIGPFAGAIDSENLVLKAKRAACEWLGVDCTGRYTLTKNLPVAAGLGGGSSDAAAAIRIVARSRMLPADRLDAFAPNAAKIGADVPVCLRQQAALMRGIGERIERIDHGGSLPALLVNPGVPLPTKDVFRALKAPAYEERDAEQLQPLAFDWNDPAKAANALSEGRNDLERPAIGLQPLIADVLDALRSLDGCLLARLSGSGPTCFGLFSSRMQAEEAERRLRALRPGWWVVATALS
jgi:4-diphosphocytidyl-2-C-methyl-D-erythritol kinase